MEGKINGRSESWNAFRGIEHICHKSSKWYALGWRLYSAKVANGLLLPDNEKMMQLQLAQIFQTLAPLYEASTDE